MNLELRKEELNKIKLDFLGKQGSLTAVTKHIAKLPESKRPEIGRLANEIKHTLEVLLEEKTHALKKMQGTEVHKTQIDITMPGIMNGVIMVMTGSLMGRSTKGQTRASSGLSNTVPHCCASTQSLCCRFCSSHASHSSHTHCSLHGTQAPSLQTVPGLQSCLFSSRQLS